MKGRQRHERAQLVENLRGYDGGRRSPAAMDDAMADGRNVGGGQQVEIEQPIEGRGVIGQVGALVGDRLAASGGEDSPIAPADPVDEDFAVNGDRRSRVVQGGLEARRAGVDRQDNAVMLRGGERETRVRRWP
jgi:hypothetical protein